MFAVVEYTIPLRVFASREDDTSYAVFSGQLGKSGESKLCARLLQENRFACVCILAKDSCGNQVFIELASIFGMLATSIVSFAGLRCFFDEEGSLERPRASDVNPAAAVGRIIMDKDFVLE